MPDEPIRVRFTRHAEERCADYSRSPREVADLVLDGHQRRRRNPGSADWLIAAGDVVVAYNWPDRGDRTTARVISLWPQR